MTDSPAALRQDRYRNLGIPTTGVVWVHEDKNEFKQSIKFEPLSKASGNGELSGAGCLISEARLRAHPAHPRPRACVTKSDVMRVATGVDVISVVLTMSALSSSWRALHLGRICFVRLPTVTSLALMAAVSVAHHTRIESASRL